VAFNIPHVDEIITRQQKSSTITQIHLFATKDKARPSTECRSERFKLGGGLAYDHSSDKDVVMEWSRADTAYSALQA